MGHCVRIALAVFLAVAVAGCDASSPAPVSQPTTGTPTSSGRPSGDCPISPVRKEPLPTVLGANMPGSPTWIGSDSFAAVLFYSDDGTSVMTAGGKMPDGRNTKILWLVRDPAKGPLTIRGSTPDGGTFTETVEGGGNYPSIIVVPHKGCWTMEASLTGNVVGRITVPVRDP